MPAMLKGKSWICPAKSFTPEAMQDTSREPLLNIPPLTKALSLLLFTIFLATNFFPAETQDFILRTVFVPANLSWATAYTTLSYGLLHFGWPHIAMNGFGLIAFGSAVERILGRKNYLLIFIGGVLMGSLGHWVLFPASTDPLGGASAGVSALFGAVLPLIIRRPQLWMANLVFILTNIVFGMIGPPSTDPLQDTGMSIAWQAHLFGFAFGEILSVLIIRFRMTQLKQRVPETSQTSEEN